MVVTMKMTKMMMKALNKDDRDYKVDIGKWLKMIKSQS